MRKEHKEYRKSGIECLICGNKYNGLSNHIRQKHKISLDEYCEKFNLSKDDLLSNNSKEKYRKAGEINGKKGSIRHNDLIQNDKEYREKYLKALSEGIKNSELAIEKRRENIRYAGTFVDYDKLSKRMKSYWKDPEFNKKCHAWQEDKDRVREVTRNSLKKARLTERYVSKAEKEIKKWIKELGYKTNTNRFLVEGKNRFYDIRVGRLLIEIDGPWHFEEFYSRFKKHNYDPSIDESKNQYAIDNGFVLLRVSNWGDSLEDQKSIIKAYLDKVDNLESGVYYEGVKYEN